MSLDLEPIKKALAKKDNCAPKSGIFVSFLTLLALVCLATCLFAFVIGVVTISGNSMYPEVQNGDFVVYNRLAKTPAVGQIVIIHDPVYNRYYIKRLIATQGDEVDIWANGIVAINGNALKEPYTHHLKTAVQDLAFPRIVPKGQVFVLGDNRPVSKDSRNSQIDMIKTQNLKGTLLFFFRSY